MVKQTKRERLRARLAEDKKKQASAYAQHSQSVAARRKPKPKPVPLTPAQVHSKKASDRRESYTPPGLQPLVDALGKKKQKGA